MHDWDKGETPGPTNGDMLRQAMWAMGPDVSKTIFDEEIAKIKAHYAEVERQRIAAQRAHKLVLLNQARQNVAELQRELGVWSCTVCGELIDKNKTCHGPPP